MRVQMRHALADAIVHRDERAVGLHADSTAATKKLHILKEGPNQVLGKSVNVSKFVWESGDSGREKQDDDQEGQ